MVVGPTANTTPQKFSITTSLFHGTSKLAFFSRQQPISFGSGKDYTSLPGIVTFRGNNYREGASYGTVDVKLAKLVPIWNVPTSSVAKSGGTGSWTGSGWTGQPLIVKWPEDIKSIMNIKAAKKADPNLVEVIYPCLDGNIYFLDLKDGTYTRPSIKSGGGPFKGTGSLYPDGTPMLFVGHGSNAPGKETVRVRLYSLIDQTQLYTFGSKDPNSLRSFHAYDSSALFDVKSDTIIEPGENGLLYTIKLNTKFDKAAGTLSISPGQAIKARYTAPQYRDASDNTPATRWWGMEDSAVIWRNYLYIADNGGKLMCFDLNTMELVWVQNVLDDTNGSPVFEESPEDNTCYIYISTSLHITAKGAGDPRKGGIPIWKINAATGEIVWQTPTYPCYTIADVSGGVQATPVLGKNDISNLVIYPIARTPTVGAGILVALDKKTGAEVWRTALTNYCWSSPVAVYTPQGKSYIIQCDSVGKMFLIEGTTGRILNSIDLGTNIEASPAVYGDTVVVGTRGQKIFGVRIE
jgi:outer membrane protein assembly factor BamB